MAFETRTREDRALTEHDWKSIEAMILRYGAGDLPERMLRFQEWRQAACDAPGGLSLDA